MSFFIVRELNGAQEEVQSVFNGLFHLDGRFPVQAAFRVANARFTMLNIPVAFTVVIAAFHFAEAGERREAIAQRMALEAGRAAFPPAL